MERQLYDNDSGAPIRSQIHCNSVVLYTPPYPTYLGVPMALNPDQSHSYRIKCNQQKPSEYPLLNESTEIVKQTIEHYFSNIVFQALDFQN